MKNNKGVSLTELSVVLAVIGIILAAVMEGASLRKSAEIQSFVTDIRNFQVAIEGFDTKYNDLPGDMANASSYWATNSGNSDGKITLNGTDGTKSESYRAWQQLALSNFLSGNNYTGIATVNNIQADIGINVPASKRTAVGYNIGYNLVSSYNRNEIGLGKFTSSNVNNSSALTPEEALAIDVKLDDGNPTTGIVYGIDGSDTTAGNCVSGSNYNISYKTFSCIQTFQAKP